MATCSSFKDKLNDAFNKLEDLEGALADAASAKQKLLQQIC